jgi:hypothetical protein
MNHKHYFISPPEAAKYFLHSTSNGKAYSNRYRKVNVPPKDTAQAFKTSYLRSFKT